MEWRGYFGENSGRFIDGVHWLMFISAMEAGSLLHSLTWRVSLVWHLWLCGAQKAGSEAELSTPHSDNDPDGITADSFSLVPCVTRPLWVDSWVDKPSCVLLLLILPYFTVDSFMKFISVLLCQTESNF